MVNITFQELQFIGKCQLCKRKYMEDDCKVVERKRNASTIITECPLCKESFLVMIFRGMIGLITIIGIPTDLNKQDYKKASKSAPVTIDDVLTLHSHFKLLTHGNIASRKTKNFR